MLIYETGDSPTEWTEIRTEAGVERVQVNRPEGRVGIVQVSEITAELREIHDVIAISESGDKTVKKVWSWEAETRDVDINGFVPWAFIRSTLGWNPPASPKIIRNGLMKLSPELYDALYQEFKKRPKRVLPPPSARRQVF